MVTPLLDLLVPTKQCLRAPDTPGFPHIHNIHVHGYSQFSQTDLNPIISAERNLFRHFNIDLLSVSVFHLERRDSTTTIIKGNKKQAVKKAGSLINRVQNGWSYTGSFTGTKV